MGVETICQEIENPVFRYESQESRIIIAGLLYV